MAGVKRSVLPFRMTEGQYHRAEDEFEGRCRQCGEVVMGLEGDAEKARCPSCGCHEAYGIETLLERGEIEIIPPGRKPHVV